MVWKKSWFEARLIYTFLIISVSYIPIVHALLQRTKHLPPNFIQAGR